MPEESKSWPFSSYDFFGYLMPGLIFSLSLFAWLIYAKYIVLDDKCIDAFKSLSMGNSVIILFVVMTVSYFAGHLIGAISHLLYDRIIIRNIIGYPFQRLLKTSHTPDDKTRSSYIQVMLLLSLFLIIPGFVELLIKVWESVQFAPEFYLRKDMACPIIEKILFAVILCWGMILFANRISEMNKKNIPNKNSFISFVKNYILKPIRKLTATDSLLEKEIITSFKNQMFENHHLDVNTNSSDIFWLASIDLQKNKKIDSRLMNWLNLYGCLRNYSCAFFLLAFIIVCSHWYKILWLHQVTDLRGSRILLASLIISGVLFLRYWIIYYSYYSKYIIRAYVCSMQNDNGNDGQ